MRILIDVQGAQNGSRFRGIGRYVNAFLLQLIKTKAEGDEIVLLLNGHLVEGEKEIRAAYSGLLDPHSFKVWYPLVPASWGASRNVARRLASQAIREWSIREIAPDCMLVGSLFEGCGDNVVTSVPSSGMPPTAVVFYDLIPYLFPDQYLANPMLRGWYEDKLQHLQRADLLLAISEASAQEVVAHLGMAEERVTNISSGIDADRFCLPVTDWPETARKYGVSGRFLLHAGAADPRKNLEAFLRAFGSLPVTEISDVSIVLVGPMTTAQRKALARIARTLPRGRKQVILTGHVSDYELIAFYRNALAFVFPSLHEGFGLPLLEAMAVGCPVIASNCSAFPEVVGVSEALFDPMSAESMAGLIGKVIRDREYRECLVREQSKRVSLFSWGNVADRAWSAMRDLVAPVQGKGSEMRGRGRAALVAAVANELRRSGASHRDFVLAAEAIEKTLAGKQHDR